MTDTPRTLHEVAGLLRITAQTGRVLHGWRVLADQFDRDAAAIDAHLCIPDEATLAAAIMRADIGIVGERWDLYAGTVARAIVAEYARLRESS
jgi:hypothetical protein